MMLKPAWIDNLPNELQECSVPDIMMMILDKVAIGMIGLVEGAVNNLIVFPINAALKPIKNLKILGSRPFDFIKLMKKLCIPYKDIKDCRSAADLAELAALLGCSFDDSNLWKRCYYERVRHLHFELFSAHHPYNNSEWYLPPLHQSNGSTTFHCSPGKSLWDPSSWLRNS